MIFKISVFLIRLGSLMICTHDLTVLTKIKEMTCYCKLFGYSGKMLSTIISIVLMQVSVPAENGSQQSSTFTHTLKGPALSCPLMPISDQPFRAHFMSYKLLTNNKITSPTIKAYTALIVLLKPQITK
jgi:hypothetical protein